MFTKKFVRMFFNFLYKRRPPEMVQYWKTKDSALAKITHAPEGHFQMEIEGEKYPFPGYPRGVVLLGSLAKLKLLTKELLFNKVWFQLEMGEPEDKVLLDFKTLHMPQILDEIERCRYDMLPYERMVPAVKELYRAVSKVQTRIPNKQLVGIIELLKHGLCFFLQEDDAYRFRFQWLAKYVNPKHPLKKLYRLVTWKKYSMQDEARMVFKLLEFAETTIDMKLRMRLIERILNLVFKDNDLNRLINMIAEEIDWKKLYLSKADKYYFRGKHFKVDHGHYDY